MTCTATLDDQSLTDALAEFGIRHTPSPIAGMRVLWESPGKPLGDFDAAAAWALVEARRGARDYFVSMVRSSTQRALLAGPFRTHREALDQVEAAKRLACSLDTWADFDAFGTCGLPTGSGYVGKLNDRLGLKINSG